MILHLETPLIYSHALSDPLGKQIWLKMDALQPSGSFKIRGIGHLCQHHAQQGQAVVGDVKKPACHVVCESSQAVHGGTGPGWLRCHKHAPCLCPPDAASAAERTCKGVAIGSGRSGQTREPT